MGFALLNPSYDKTPAQTVGWVERERNPSPLGTGQVRHPASANADKRRNAAASPSAAVSSGADNAVMAASNASASSNFARAITSVASIGSQPGRRGGGSIAAC